MTHAFRNESQMLIFARRRERGTHTAIPRLARAKDGLGHHSGTVPWLILLSDPHVNRTPRRGICLLFVSRN